MIFTTPEDYQSWAEADSPPSSLIVEQANDAIASVLRGALYDADREGRPTTGFEEIKRAANVQVHALLAAENSAADPPLQSATIAGASYTYATPSVGDLTISEGLSICAWSAYILMNAPGVYWGYVFVEG